MTHELYEFLENQKKLNIQITLNLYDYISSFNTIDKIDVEISNLCASLEEYRQVISNTKLVLNLKIQDNSSNFYSDPKYLLHHETVNQIDDVNLVILTYYQNKMSNPKYDGKIFDLSDNNVMILDLGIQIINKIYSHQFHNKNIMSCYKIPFKNLEQIENIYKKKIEQNQYLNSSDIKKIIQELEYDLNIIKMHYLDAILFIKDQERILSNFSDDFEKITQMKIIELNKYKLYLLYSD